MPDKRLLKAVKRDDCEAVDRIINDFGISMYNESDPIISDDHLIFNVDSSEMFELLLKNGYPLHFRSIKNKTEYTIIIENYWYNRLEIIIKYGQKIDAVMTGLNEYRNITPLHYMMVQCKEMASYQYGTSIWHNILKTTTFLLTHGHPVDVLDRKNRTPLHYIFCKYTGYTCMKAIRAMMELLLNHGANPLLRDTYGYGQKPSDYIKRRCVNRKEFTILFNAEKKRITLFELMLPMCDDDLEPKRKIQRIK